MTEAKKKKNKQKKDYEFDTKYIHTRLTVMGLLQEIEQEMATRFGTTFEECFGPVASKLEHEVRARGYVYWLIRERFDWSYTAIERLVGVDHSAIIKAIRREDEHQKKTRARAS